jgi:hypothetical protein
MDSAQPRAEEVRCNRPGKNVVRTIIKEDLLALLRACPEENERRQDSAGRPQIAQQRPRDALIGDIDHNGIVGTAEPRDLTQFVKRVGEIENEAIACRWLHVIALASAVGA